MSTPPPAVGGNDMRTVFFFVTIFSCIICSCHSEFEIQHLIYLCTFVEVLLTCVRLAPETLCVLCVVVLCLYVSVFICACLRFCVPE